MKILNPFAASWYTPREEVESQTATPARFKLRGLNGSELGYMVPEFVLDDESRMIKGLTGKGIDLALRHGLQDWENVENESGVVAFSPNNFGLLPLVLRVELAMQIVAASYVKKEEQKN